MKEQILDDENAAGLDRREQGAERDLLMVRRMACVVDDYIKLAADLMPDRAQLVGARRIGAEYLAALDFHGGEIVEVEPEYFAAGEVARPHAQRWRVPPVRLTFVAQLLVVPSAAPHSQQPDLENTDRPVAKRLQKLGIDARVMMAPAASAFVRAVEIGQ